MWITIAHVIYFANAFVSTSSSHLTALSSASWSSINTWSANFVWVHDSMMWIIVCYSPHWHLSEEVRHHFCRLDAHNLCSYRSGSAMTMCGGVIRSPVARQLGWIPVPCWPRLLNPKLLATSFLYQKWSSPNHSGFVEQSQAGGCANTSLWTGQS